MIDQDPGPGSQLARGDRVTLIVSTGAGSVIVPNVVGQPKDTAASRLTAAGLNVEIVEQEVSDKSDDERVLEQAPSAGERLRSGDRVTIFVGVFIEPETTTTSTTPTTTTLPEPAAPANPKREARGGQR